jgi:hypothetical protein
MIRKTPERNARDQTPEAKPEKQTHRLLTLPCAHVVANCFSTLTPADSLPAGIALAAIQGLNMKLEASEEQLSF